MRSPCTLRARGPCRAVTFQRCPRAPRYPPRPGRCPRPRAGERRFPRPRLPSATRLRDPGRRLLALSDAAEAAAVCGAPRCSPFPHLGAPRGGKVGGRARSRLRAVASAAPA